MGPPKWGYQDIGTSHFWGFWGPISHPGQMPVPCWRTLLEGDVSRDDDSSSSDESDSDALSDSSSESSDSSGSSLDDFSIFNSGEPASAQCHRQTVGLLG